MGKLDGKVAIVTGAGRGIGAEIARKLAGDGAAVACAGSVTEAGFAERFTGTAVDAFGGLDIIVNNAGYTWDSVIQKMSDEQWDAILDVHLKAPFRILRAAQPVISGLVKQARADGQPVPGRKVVNISSIAGLGGNAGQIKVGVNPGLLAAMEQLIPLGRADTPADAAGAVYLFCIAESDYVSAQTLICGGGFFG
jgi:3-oxoacyl-[acyl-carrier protein] reductase